MLTTLLIQPIISIQSIQIQRDSRSVQQIGLGYSILSLMQTQILMIQFDNNNASMFQFQTEGSLISLGIDGISQWLIWQVNMLMPIVIQSVYKDIPTQVIVNGRYALSNPVHTQQLMQIQLIFIGFWSVAVFMVQNILQFYISFEGVLIPLYYIITQYGSRNKKVHASYMFFIYTLLGSLFQFMAQLGLYLDYGTGDYQIQQMSRSALEPSTYEYIQWIAFFICFAIKLPIVGFHGWLLSAHVESPTSGSVLQAAVLQKMGSYGLQRYSIPLFPVATEYFRPIIYVICIISIQYSSISAQSQSDMKIVIAYSSIGHMGTATLGLFSNDQLGIEGSIFFQISHGLISAGQFLQVGSQYQRHHTRNTLYYRGLVMAYPIYITQLFIFSMANSSVPITSGFVGEFQAQQGAFNNNPFVAIFASLSIIQVPSFMLNQQHRVAYGSFTPYMPVVYSDITRKEINLFIPLLFFTIFLGIYPQFMLNDVLEPSMALIIQGS